MAPPNALCSKCSRPMQMKEGERKRASKKFRVKEKALRFPEAPSIHEVVTTGNGCRRSIRANNPAPATAEIAAWRYETGTTVEAIAATISTATAAIEAAATTATTEAATTTAATAATTTLRLRSGAAGGKHDGGGTDQTNAINRDERRGCEAAGQKVTALRYRLSHSWDLPFCRSTALECFRCRIVQQSYSASNSSSRMLM